MLSTVARRPLQPVPHIRATRQISMPTPIWTLALINGVFSIAVTISISVPLNSSAPVRVGAVCAGLGALMALGLLIFGNRIGERTLLAVAATRIAITAVVAGAAATASGTLLVCTGFIWVGVWVALFFPGRVLVTTLALELVCVALTPLVSPHPLRTLVDATLMVGASAVVSAVLWQVVGTLRRQARRDHLTGLINRCGVVQCLSELDWRRRWRQRDDNVVSLVVIDLDGLKAVNDRDGHAAGDRMLVAFATELASAAGVSDVAARIGGDEFLAILPGASATEAIAWAEGFRVSSRLCWSFGVAEREVDDTLESWLARADQRMYVAKAAGHGRPRHLAGAAAVGGGLPRQFSDF